MQEPPYERELCDSLVALSLPPLEFKVLECGGGPGQPDAVLEVRGARFAVEYSRNWAPKAVTSATAQARHQAQRVGALPMVLVPFLSEERLLALEAEGVSGLDLCGNGVVSAPGAYTVFRTGRPNRFSSSAPIKNIYRGATSLVARTLLTQPRHRSPGALREFLQSQGGVLSSATISKALHGLEDDALISREWKGITLLQPEKLLQLLERNFTPPIVRRRLTGRVALSLPDLRQHLAAKSQIPLGLVATGVASAPRYVSIALEDQAALYCRSMASLLEGLSFEETTRFPNLQLIETDDVTVYAGAQRDAIGYPWASPIQTYLEMATGEPRLRKAVESLRDVIMEACR